MAESDEGLFVSSDSCSVSQVSASVMLPETAAPFLTRPQLPSTPYDASWQHESEAEAAMRAAMVEALVAGGVLALVAGGMLRDEEAEAAHSRGLQELAAQVASSGLEAAQFENEVIRAAIELAAHVASGDERARQELAQRVGVAVDARSRFARFDSSSPSTSRQDRIETSEVSSAAAGSMKRMGTGVTGHAATESSEQCCAVSGPTLPTQLALHIGDSRPQHGGTEAADVQVRLLADVQVWLLAREGHGSVSCQSVSGDRRRSALVG